MKMDKVLFNLEAFKAERIKYEGVELPPPNMELFQKMGATMESEFKAQLVIALNIDPALLKDKAPKEMMEVWSTVARVAYKYIALSGGATTERIE